MSPLCRPCQVPRVCAVKKTAETPQLQVVDVPVQLVAQVPRVEVVEEAVEIPQLQAVKKIGVIPETFETSELQLEGTQTSESLNTAFLRRVTQAEIRASSMPEHGWSSGMQRSTQQRVSSQAVASNNYKQHNKREREKERKGGGERGQVEKEKGREERERGKRGKREKETEEQGKGVQEETDKEVKKDVTDWVEVRKRTRRKSRKMVQIFVKVDGGKTSTMEMEMSDKVDDIVKKIPICDQDVYVTSGGRILKGSDKLESCEVRDGSTIQVTSRMRGGGRRKDKKSKVEKKQVTRQEPLKNGCPAILESEKEAVIRMLEETDEYRKIVEDVSGGSDVDVERKMRHWASILQERPRGDILECGLRWAVEARRKGRDKQQEQATSKARRKDRTGTKQARQASTFRRRTTAGEDGSGKRRRTRGDEQNDRGTDRQRKYRPRPRGR